jgi:hypothetical protein
VARAAGEYVPRGFQIAAIDTSAYAPSPAPAAPAAEPMSTEISVIRGDEQDSEHQPYQGRGPQRRSRRPPEDGRCEPPRGERSSNHQDREEPRVDRCLGDDECRLSATKSSPDPLRSYCQSCVVMCS